MVIQIVCPSCRTTYTIAEELSGKEVRCKNCKAIFTAKPSQASAPVEERAKALPGEPPEAETRERRRPQPRPAASARRRDRYEDDEDDFQPQRRRAGKRNASHLGLFMILGGVIASLVTVVACIVFAIWLFTREAAKDREPQVAMPMGPQVFGGQPADDNDPNGNKEDNKQDAPNDVNVKEPEPPPPEPKEPEFISPVSQEIAPAKPAGPAKAELDPEVVQKVKGATVFLSVTLPDGHIGQGSGFFGVERNLILTNAHVVGMLRPESPKPKSIVAVRNKGTPDERKFGAELLGLDRSADLAVLRVKGGDAPPPLEVKSAANLRETQRVWVAGFPLGERPGREISLSDSSVSSLRRDDNGMLTRVQVNGGMEPGNSGGPVVDAYGNVIGVSVSIFRGTKLNFAVPGDSVRNLINGRIAGLILDQPYLKEGKNRALATLRLIDPLRNIRQPALEIWTGNPSTTPRPPATTQPAAQSGDSPHDRQGLVIHGDEARADVVLPPLPPGKVYWVQPRWLDSAGKPRWASAHVYDVPPPVELRPVSLTLKHQTGSREATLNNWNTMKVSDPERGEATWSISSETHFLETTEAIDKEEFANVRLNYRSYNQAFRVDNQVPPSDKNLRKIRQDIRNLSATFQLDKQGNPMGQEVDLKNVPRASHDELTGLYGSLQQLLDGITMPMPNKQVAPGDVWKSERSLPLYRQGFWSPTATLEMTYKYLGTRQHGGRNEAVVALKGQAQKVTEHNADIGGRAEGTAVVDLANGQVLQVDVFFYFDVEMQQPPGGRGVKTNGTSHIRLMRTLPPGARS